jgi:NADH-quinone oxidoreductase subunit N
MPKIIIFSVIVKLFLLTFTGVVDFYYPQFLFASISSIAIGSIAAIYQKRVKRLFAYSAISHTGFILLALVSASSQSVNSLIFYVIIYAALTILLFSILIFAALGQKNFPAYIAN